MNSNKPAGCPIAEDTLGETRRFTIPPQPGVVSPAQLFFAFTWAAVWGFAIILYVMIPNSHGAIFNFFALVFGIGGELLALWVFTSAWVACFAIETISLGPKGVTKEIRLGPMRRTRRVELARARGFRVDAFPRRVSRPGERGWAAHLYLQITSARASPETSGRRPSGLPLRLAEGARDEDKFWLAHRLNQGLRARQGGA